MRYITAVVLFTIGATVQALPARVSSGSVGLLPRQSDVEELTELLDSTIAELLHAKSLAALVAKQPTHKRSAVMSKLPSAIKGALDDIGDDTEYGIEDDVKDLGNDLNLKLLDSGTAYEA